MRNTLRLLILVSLLGGCSTYAADRYSVSMDTHVALERAIASQQGQKVAVDEFGATNPGRTQIDCRAVGPIKTPDNETFEAFVRKALVDQLQLADLYSPDAQRRIGGSLDEINFSSVDGRWFLALTVTGNPGRRFTVREEYDYDTSFYGETACNQTAQALMPAVQNLILKVVSHPEFRRMVNGPA